jgi:lipopolysaccharide transport system ATP-binding protein
MPVISVSSLSKSYRLGTIGGGTLREDVSRWWAKLRGRPDPTLKIGQDDNSRLHGQEFWALRDVTFGVQQGEILGIIGRNGAGKSTLLKILSRVTAPTSGEVRVKGRIASLLEVGTGFHPELTGRDNIFLNGAILGMSKAEIKRSFHEIVAFSGVEDFIDTPVKRYSSGMYVRLAFAVAAHLEPEILIVDEVLAVGDAQFQKKCLGKIGEVSREGRTVLLVSHNMHVIGALCKSAICLSNGNVCATGPVREVIDHYLGDGADDSTLAEATWELENAPGDASTRLLAVRIADDSGETAYNHDITKPVTVHVEFALLKSIADLACSIHVYNQEGLCLFAVGAPVTDGADDRPQPLENREIAPGIYRSSCLIPANYLNDGLHRISAFVVQNKTNFPAQSLQEVSFFVNDYGASRGGYLGKIIGAVRPTLPWASQRIGELTGN